MLTPLEVVFAIPSNIQNGLLNGSLKRFGGTIRNASNGQIVTMLNEIGGRQVSASVMPFLNPGLGLLNLSVSACGFAFIIKQNLEISDKLRRLETTLKKLDKKVDFQQLAKLTAGIDQCMNSTTLKDAGLQKTSAVQAINNLLQARHYFTLCACQEAEEGSLVADEYIEASILAYMIEIQTYLALDEQEKAIERLKEALDTTAKPIAALSSVLLKLTPALLLPVFTGKVTLERIAKLQRWVASQENRYDTRNNHIITESMIFEQARLETAQLYKSEQKWFQDVPSTIVNREEIGDWYFGPINTGTDEQKLKKAAVKGVPKAFETVEALIEAHQRMQGFLVEIKLMQMLGIDAPGWSQMKELPEGQASCILFSETLQKQLTENVSRVMISA